VQEFIEAENKITEKYLQDSPVSLEVLTKKLTEVYDYPKYGTPSKHGSHYFFSKNSGLQNQPYVI